MMNKELKDYLHLHLGCEVLYKSEIYFLCGISTPYRTNDKTLATFSVRPNKKGFRSISHSMENFDEIKLILRPLPDMTDSEINDIVSIMLGREVTCGRIWRSEDKDFIIADFKQEKPLPPYNEKYKSMSMGVYIKGDFQVDYKWNYYTEENCEGSCGVTDEPLHNHNEITRYMLSKHFDVFGLIDAGLAIDKTKL